MVMLMMVMMMMVMIVMVVMRVVDVTQLTIGLCSEQVVACLYQLPHTELSRWTTCIEKLLP